MDRRRNMGKVPAVTLDELKSRRAALQLAVKEVDDQIKEIELATMPYHVGDIVEYRAYGMDWITVIVRSCNRYGGYRVSPLRKNGQWSLAERHAWESVMRYKVDQVR